MAELTQQDYQANPATPSTASTADGKITAAEIRRRWDASQKATAKERRDWWVNTAMISGEQWLSWEPQSSTLVAVPRDGDRVRVTVNKLRSASRSIIAKLTRRPLVFEVGPTSADDASAGGARTATAVAADVAHRHQWEALRAQAAWAAWKGGTSLLCTEWDPQAGTPLGVSATGKHFGEGDTTESVLNVTQVATEPGEKDIEHGYWWIKGSVLPPSKAKAMFGLDREPPADATALLSPLQRRLMSDNGNGSTDMPLTLVLTYFERPGPDCPGQHAVMVDNRIVQHGSWPFPFTDRLNCVAIRETIVEERWTGETVVSDAVPVQVAINQSWSSIVEHMKLAGNARLAVPDGAGDDWDDLSDLPAEIVRYSGINPPQWIGAPNQPQWWIEQPLRLQGELDDILGHHAVSRGDNRQDQSGVALNILAENDDTPLGMMAKELAQAWGRLASLVLEVYEQKVTESRKATVERPGSAPEVVTWSGADLHGQTTAVVPFDAVAPRSRAGQMAIAMQLHDRFPEMDLKTFARIADLPDAQDLVEAVDMDTAKARRENGEMAAGNVCVPATFDQHAVHIKVHNDFRKTPRYEALDDDVRLMVDEHLQAHETLAAEQMGEQVARGNVSPALAAAAQADEPPMAGDPSAAADLQAAQAQGVAKAAAQAGKPQPQSAGRPPVDTSPESGPPAAPPPA